MLIDGVRRREFLAASGAASLPLADAARIEWEHAELSLSLDPPVSAWQRTGPGEFSGGGYRLRLETARDGAETRVEFHLRREDGAEFTVHNCAVRAAVDFSGIYRVWSYRGGPLELMAEFDAYTRGVGSLDSISAANTGIPLLVCTDRQGRNRFTLGLLDQMESARLKTVSQAPRDVGLAYTFEFSRPYDYSLRRTEFHDGWFLSTAPADWFDAVARYSRWAEERGGIRKLAPPAAAYAPVWNSWYPFGQRIDEETIRDNARLCRKIGIGHICIDAGYQNSLTGGMSNAEEIRLFNDHTGDWTADRGKFPHLAGLVERIHGQGQLVSVWVALFLMGQAVKSYRKAREMLMRDANGQERLHLCPRHPDTAGYLAETFGRLAREYGLDGFWLDFMDNMHGRCHAAHKHWTGSPCEGYNRCLAAVRDAVLAHKRDFLLETRMKMSNLNVKAFCNVIETTDMPFDFDINRALGVFVRAFGAGTAVKIDPAQWHVKEAAANVAKSCATVMACGTPVFGIDLRRLPEAHLRVIAAWMRLYGEHRLALSRARVTPACFERLFPQLHIDAGDLQFIYVGSSATAPVSVRGTRLMVLNASDSDRVVLRLDAPPGKWKATVKDCYLQPQRTWEIASLWLDEQVPQGGLLELRRM